MNKIETFEQFLSSHAVQISTTGFIVNLAVAATLLYILSKVYLKYGRSLSNRNSLSRNFVMIGVTTMIIITIVKSSLALSLGLVGALSIVRFRTAIKEPEELAYIFLTIAIGLGLGANQIIITVIGFVFVVSLIVVSTYLRPNEENRHIHLLVSGKKRSEKNGLDDLVKIISQYSKNVNMKRFDENSDIFEISVLVELIDYNSLNQLKLAIDNYDENMSLSIMDNKGLA